MIRAVIFDMDGVLIDSEPLWREAILSVFAGIGVPLTMDQVVQTQGTRVDQLVAYWRGRFPWEGPSTEEVAGRIVQAVIQRIETHRTPKAGAAEALGFFRREGLPVGLASSSPTPLIRAVLAALDLESAFDAVCSAEVEPHGKPHPGVYLTTAARLGVPPAECLVFEDSVAGVLSAKAAGMVCVCVPESALVGDRRLGIADVVLPSLADFTPSVWAALSVDEPGVPPTGLPDLIAAIQQEQRAALAAVDAGQIVRLRQAMRDASRIFVAGRGRTGLQMQGFAMRLMHLDLPVHVVGDVTTPGIRTGDLLLIGSASGRTASLLAFAERARKAGGRVALITAAVGSALAGQADALVRIPAPTPKSSDNGGLRSIQPMADLFEGALGLLLGALIMQLKDELGVSEEQMYARHANLE